MSGSRPGEVSVRWAAKRLGLHAKTIRRWCVERRLEYVRPELGGRRFDNGERYIKCYWLSRDEISKLRVCEDAASP